MSKPKPIDWTPDGNAWKAVFQAYPQVGQHCIHCQAMDERKSPDGPLWMYEVEKDAWCAKVSVYCNDCATDYLEHRNRHDECATDLGIPYGDRVDACKEKKEKDEGKRR